MSMNPAQARYRAVACAEGYRVGDDGTVLSCRLPGTCRLSEEWRPLKIQKDAHTGYARVTLRIDGRSVHAYVHRLVLEAFVGPCPEGMEACHFPDQDRMNCRLENLRWDTRAANQADKVAHGTSNRGARRHMARLSDADVLDMVATRKAIPSATYTDLAILYGVSMQAVANIFQGHNWGWLTEIKPMPGRRGCPGGKSRKYYRDLGQPN
jgi:hypothetical protein